MRRFHDVCEEGNEGRVVAAFQVFIKPQRLKKYDNETKAENPDIA
jgi:hypothetical protein